MWVGGGEGATGVVREREGGGLETGGGRGGAQGYCERERVLGTGWGWRGYRERERERERERAQVIATRPLPINP